MRYLQLVFFIFILAHYSSQNRQVLFNEYCLKVNVSMPGNKMMKPAIGQSMGIYSSSAIRLHEDFNVLWGTEFTRTKRRVLELLDYPSGNPDYMYTLNTLSFPFFVRYAGGNDIQLISEFGIVPDVSMGASKKDTYTRDKTFSAARLFNCASHVALGMKYNDEKVTYLFRLECRMGFRDISVQDLHLYNRYWSAIFGISI